jgi:hypothetical protein
MAFLACTALPLRAQENGWEMFDSPKPSQTSGISEPQVIYENLIHLIEAWNTHNLDEFLKGYWNSPRLLVVADMQ